MYTGLDLAIRFREKGGFGGHQTFPPRYGWLKKGYDAICEDETIFTKPDAVQRLGVGKNMVRSIRHWCLTFNIAQSGSRGSVTPTDFGDLLLGEKGWDPFLEDVASLWLLHWQMFVPTPYLEAPTWVLAFNKCSLPSFEIGELAASVQGAARLYACYLNTPYSAFEKDASCLVRMYHSALSDSEIASPFSELGLIKKGDNRRTFAFDNSDKSHLSPLVFLAVCCSYMITYSPLSQKSISLHRLAYDVNSPGVAFRVPENSVASYLHDATRQLDGFELVDTAGDIRLSFNRDISVLRDDALRLYYGGKASK